MGALVLGLEDADERIRGACIDGYLHPRFFDEQLGSAIGAIDYVRDSGN